MALVYTYTENNEQFPNVHTKPSAFKDKKTALQKTGKGYEEIKNRYLDSINAQINAQIKSQGNNVSEEDMKIGEEGIYALQEQFTRKFNNYVHTENTEGQKPLDAYMTQMNKVIDEIMENTTRDADAATGILSGVIGVFKDYAGASEFVKDVNKKGKKVQVKVTISDIIHAHNFMKRLEGTTKTKAFKDLNSALGFPNEAITALLGLKAMKTAGNLLEELDKSLSGTQSNPHDIFDKSIQDKSVDIVYPNAEYSLKIDDKKITLSLVTNASVKAYASDTDFSVNLISVGGRNSILIPMLQKLYQTPSNKEQVNYHIYNTLAFSGKGNDVLETNYQIIQDDLIRNYAERFIAGFNAETMQTVIISDFVAYPMLSIINAIVEDLEAENSQRYFSLAIESLGKDDNKPRKAGKLARLKHVVDKINSLKVRGQLSPAVFKNLLNEHNSSKNLLADGISIAALKLTQTKKVDNNTSL